MRFDWYQTTVSANPVSGVNALRKLGHELRPSRIHKAYRFETGHEIYHHQKGVVAQIMYNPTDKAFHAFASSDNTDAFAHLIRERWPHDHEVTRLDSAQDFHKGGSYESLHKVAKRIAQEHRLQFPAYGDELNPRAGRTQYIGSNKSDYKVRIYEKGFQYLKEIAATLKPGLNRDLLEEADVIRLDTGEKVRLADWSRVELQARPRGTEARQIASQLSPEEAWGLTPWARQLAAEAMALDLERIVTRHKSRTTDEEAVRWMCRHYGKVLSRLHADLGDWACVGKQIGDILEDENS